MQNRRISVDKVCVSGTADRGDVSSRRRVCKQTSVDCSLAARAVLPTDADAAAAAAVATICDDCCR